MSRIVLATFGSLGDLHPALALAHELRRRGHEAVIATSEPYRAKVTAQGLPFAPIRPDLSLANPDLVRRVMDGRRGSEHLLRELVYPSIRDMHADLTSAAAGADFLLASELACAVPLVAEQLRLPWAYFALSPISFLSVYDPAVLPGPAFLHRLQRIGPRTNRLILRVAQLVTHSWWAPVRQFRRELGLPPTASPLFDGKYSPHLNLALFSSVLQGPQRDWPAHTHQPGFCFFDEPASAAVTTPPPLPAAVVAFLNAGEPPVVFTLGSAAVQLADDFYLHSARAAQRLGRRAILLLGENPPPPDLPPSILAWGYLPYAQIFPHAAAIVHQGGVGTTAQALRAGRPMLIVPFAHDQFDNAARIVRLGSGLTLSRRRYATAAAHALTALLSDPRIAQVAAHLGSQIRTERGTSTACDLIEQALAPHRPRPRSAP